MIKFFQVSPLLALIYASGCAILHKNVATDTFCLIYVPVYVSRADQISEITAQMILRNNLYWSKHCAPSSS